MTIAVTVDMAGGHTGGAGRFRFEVNRYLTGHARADVKVIGSGLRLNPAWLVGREAVCVRRSRRVALNNVGFFTPGGERWTLLANALHFLTEAEAATLDRALLTMVRRQAAVVYRAARHSDVLIAPSTTMAERIACTLPGVEKRLVVRMHPVTAQRMTARPDGQLILCPVIFESYKHMVERLGEWVAAVDNRLDSSVRLVVTASPAEVPAPLAAHPRLHLVGRLDPAALYRLRTRCRAIFFPSGLESFGCPLAEARVHGQPVIAQDTWHNREIAGGALCGFTLGDPDSLREATERALVQDIVPDPGPFDPKAYFDWMLGSPENSGE